MLQKIIIVNQRFDELNDLIIQPDIISDQKKYVKLTKEYKDIKTIVEIGEIYKSLLDNRSEAEEIISNEKKLISNSGYFNNKFNKLNKLSKSTALQSTLLIEDHSSCNFKMIEKSNFIVDQGLKVTKKNIVFAQ